MMLVLLSLIVQLTAGGAFCDTQSSLASDLTVDNNQRQSQLGTLRGKSTGTPSQLGTLHNVGVVASMNKISTPSGGVSTSESVDCLELFEGVELGELHSEFNHSPDAPLLFVQ